MSKGFNDQEWNDLNSAPTEYQRDGYEPAPKKKGLGCCFYGCATAVVLLVITGIGCFFLFRFISQEFQKYRAMYTDDAPKALPVVKMPDEQRAEIVKRVEAFGKRLKTPEDQGPPLTDDERTLVLTADELNAYIEKNSEFRGKFYALIEDGKIRAQVSLPLEGIPGLGGRYLNGESDVELSVNDDGDPVVRLRNLKVKGKPLPAAIRDGVEGKNLAVRNQDGNAGQDDEEKPIFARKLEKIEVKDGKLIVVIKPRLVETIEATHVEWKTDAGGNGHFYGLIKEKKSWKDAKKAAAAQTFNGMPGHLVTIGSEAENAFLRDRIAVNERAWIGLSDDPESGGKESHDLAVPKREGWAWVTGEPVEFVAWSEGEPDNGGEKAPENFVEFNGTSGPRRGQWSDLANDVSEGRYYIIEFEAAKSVEKK